MGPQLGCPLMVLAAVLLVAGFFVQRRNLRKLVPAAAEALGLGRTRGGGQTPDGWEQRDVFTGTVGATALTIARGAKSADAVPLQAIIVEARLPSALGYRLEVRRAVWGMPRDWRSGDAEFDAGCAVTTDDPAAAAATLSEPSLRHLLVALLRAEAGLGVVNAAGVETAIFVGPFTRLPAVEKRLRAVCTVVDALSKVGRSTDAAPVAR